eukprot:s975_g45.t1
MASTATPGSSKKILSISPAPTELDRPPVLDYWSIPSGESMGIVGDSDDDSFDLMAEIERAKKHPQFGEFVQWLVLKYELEDDLPNSSTWGAAVGDPLEDFKDFARWLVETNQGRWDNCGDENSADHMALVMEGWDWSQCFVRGGGFILDFVGPNQLKYEPARCQFPLTICTCLPVEDGLEEGE